MKVLIVGGAHTVFGGATGRGAADAVCGTATSSTPKAAKDAAADGEPERSAYDMDPDIDEPGEEADHG